MLATFPLSLKTSAKMVLLSKDYFFFANIKCFVEATLPSCINSFISFMLFVKVQKPHKLHSQDFVPIQQALEKCGVEANVLFVG